MISDSTASWLTLALILCLIGQGLFVSSYVSKAVNQASNRLSEDITFLAKHLGD